MKNVCCRIGILTYQMPHRKTFDTLSWLKALGYRSVTVFAVPPSYRKKFCPKYRHRPGLPNPELLRMEYDMGAICRNMGYEYRTIKDYAALEEGSCEVYLVCGAGLLPEDFVRSRKVINSHPGYIPYVRGLDALKWAIVEKEKIGVTTHFIGDEVDAGEVLERLEIPVYRNDTFFELAERQYQYEILALVHSLELIDEAHEIYRAGNSVQHRRMPEETEQGLMTAFAEYCRDFGV